jgi:hypothetical protein
MEKRSLASYFRYRKTFRRYYGYYLSFERHQIPRISLARRNVRRGMETPKPMPMVARRPSTTVSMIWTPDSDQKLGENKGFYLFFSPFLSKFFRHKDD